MKISKGQLARYVTGRSDISETDETRFEIVKIILTEFPTLRDKVLRWLQETELTKD